MHNSTNVLFKGIRAGKPRSWRHWLAELVAVCGLMAAVAFGVFYAGGYRHVPSLGSPLLYGADALNMYALRGMDSAGLGYDERSSAPFNLPVRHVPDAVHCYAFSMECTLLRGLGKVFKRPVPSVNVYFFLVFFLAAGSAYLTLRWLGLRRCESVLGGSAYALLPYHFMRGVNHLSVANYALVPLLLLICYGIYRSGFLDNPRSDWRSELGRRPVMTAVLCLVLLWSGTNDYYCFFFLLFAGFAAVLSYAQTRRLAPLLLFGGTAVAVGVWYGMKSLFLRLSWGQFVGITFGPFQFTSYGEDELYPLKLVQLLFPAPNHRIEAFADFTRTYAAAHPLVNENASNALGLFLAAALVAILCVALFGTVRRGGMLHFTTRAAIFALLLGAMGGAGTLISEISWRLAGPHFALSQARAWNRIYVFLAFVLVWFAVAGVAWLRRRATARLSHIAIARNLVGPVLVLMLLAFVLYDQVPPANVAGLQARAAAFQSDVGFFSKLDSHYGRRYQVFIWPAMVPFGGRYGSLYYSEANRPLLASDRAVISFGAAPGTVGARWLANVARKPPQAIPARLCETGFDGVLVFKKALDEKTRPLLTFLANQNPPAEANQDFAYFPLNCAPAAS